MNEPYVGAGEGGESVEPMQTEIRKDGLTVIAENAAQTRELGRVIGATVRPGQCIALDGDLGVGKTELVRGMALGAGVADPSLVSSPTYVLLNIYAAGAGPEAKTVYHLDAYRITDPSGFDAVGWDELIGEGGIVVVEWAQRVAALFPTDTLYILGKTLNTDTRSWALSEAGESSHRLLEVLARKLENRSPR
jgi:tRNA threonylcarbamoyladenosine biosynthesis protein TsaE